MTATIVVGYTATDAGNDAAALGARLARSVGAALHLVIVLPAEGSRNAAVPPERAYADLIDEQAQQWLRDAVAAQPDDLTATGHVLFAESFAEGLIAAAEEFSARIIAIGAANGALFGRHRLGSVAGELLHSSSVPVALAPCGTAQIADDGISRVSAAVGTRPGADRLIDEAAQFSSDAAVPLRLLSLLPFDVPPGLNTGALAMAEARHADAALERAGTAVAQHIETSVERVSGASVEDAVSSLTWEPGEVIFVGSSRLAQPRRLFLGSTAAKMLSRLPVPMVVVPRTGDIAPSRES